MKKIGITTISSLAVNVILSLWLVNQYFYDQYFHAYVDAALGPVYPFIVLTAGLGGGSSLGYLLLKRRHAGNETGRIEKAKLFKSSGPVQSSASSSQGRILPTGPPPGQVSRHTAYAVPPLPKSSSSSGAPRGATPPSVSMGSKASPPPSTTSQRLEQLTQPSTSVLNSTLRDQFRPEPIPRSSPPVPPQGASRGESPQPVNRIPPESSKMGFPQQWKPEPSPGLDRGFDSTVFPRPNQMDVKSSGESSPFGSTIGQVPKPPQPSQTPFPVSKWAPPDQKGETQWTDPVPKPGLAAPQKWAPPPGQGFGPRPPQGGPPRLGAGPVPGPTGQRPPYPPGQAPPPPRPLGFPGSLRPGQPGPIGVPPPFRSDQPRPPGQTPQGRPVQSPGGPMPQPWSPQKPADKTDRESSAESKDFGSSSPRPPQFGSDSSRPFGEKTPEQSAGGGEMDWDTALDTILKTLKKDRGVGEKA